MKGWFSAFETEIIFASCCLPFFVLPSGNKSIFAQGLEEEAWPWLGSDFRKQMPWQGKGGWCLHRIYAQLCLGLHTGFEFACDKQHCNSRIKLQ